MTTSRLLPEALALNEATEQLFKGAMRRLASGVALVTTTDAAGTPCGIAMTAFMSLSMEPPSLLLAINRNASLCEPLLERGRFAVSIMASAQRDECQAFVALPPPQRFESLAWELDPSGMPVVSSAVARIICGVGQAESFGSHMIVKGLVESVVLGEDRAPLIYVSGRYGTAALDG